MSTSRAYVHPDGRVTLSAAAESFSYAVRELRDEFGREVHVERVGPDLGIIAAGGPSVNEVAIACARRPLVFIRHLSVEMARVPREAAVDIAAVGDTVLAVLADSAIGPKLAIQAWVSGSSPRIGYSSGELYHRLAQDLADQGLSVGHAGQEHVLSCCITPRGVSVGLNRTEDSLADWPGGRVRLARDEARVSRAEFKLEELFQLFPLALPTRGRAVDLGASPGGWTRILRQRGMVVWAVDPGDLDPRVATDQGVRHVRTTAGEFFRATDLTFDLAVNDMRMDSVMTSQVMVDAADRVRPGGFVVITLKTGDRQPVETVRRCLTLLGREYEVIHVRQLHHNRHEVTVVARRRQARLSAA